MVDLRAARAAGALALVLLAMPLLAGCAGPAPAPDVLATFYPLQYLAARVAGAGPDGTGGNVTVGALIDAGTAPHDYEPTPGDVRRIADTRLLIVQGAGFEGWLQAARADAPNTQVTVATHGLPLHDNPDPAEAARVPQDPHAWLDPTLYARMARNVERAMVAAFPQHEHSFHARADALASDLEQLDAGFRTGLAECDLHVAVTNHDAFGYLGARYGFDLIAITGLDPEAEPTPETMRRVVDQVREHGVDVVFFEDLVSPAVAQAVAREAGVTTRVLSPVEGIPADEAAAGADYLSKMRDNLAALRAGMRCR